VRTPGCFANQSSAFCSWSAAFFGFGIARWCTGVFAAEPVCVREALRGVFENGRVEMHPGEDGTYVAKATFLPFAAITIGDRRRKSPNG
jgi:hypothetical protein